MTSSKSSLLEEYYTSTMPQDCKRIVETAKRLGIGVEVKHEPKFSPVSTEAVYLINSKDGDDDRLTRELYPDIFE